MKILNIFGMIALMSLTSTMFYACNDEAPIVKEEPTKPGGEDNEDNDTDGDVVKKPSVSGIYSLYDTEYSTPLTTVELGTEVVVKGENLGAPTAITVCGMKIDLQNQVKDASADKLTVVLPSELPVAETKELVYATSAGEAKVELAIENNSTEVTGIDNEYALAGKEVEFFGTDFYYNRDLKVILGSTELELNKTNDKLSVTIPQDAQDNQTLTLSYTGRDGEEKVHEYPYRKTPEIFLCRINESFAEEGTQMEGINWITYPYKTGANNEPKPVTVSIKSESNDTSKDFYFEAVADNLPAWAYSSVATGTFKKADLQNYETIKSQLSDYWFKFEISIPETSPFPHKTVGALAESKEFQLKLGQTAEGASTACQYNWTGYDFGGNYHTYGKWRTVSISLDEMGEFYANKYGNVQFYCVTQYQTVADYIINWKFANFRIEKKN